MEHQSMGVARSAPGAELIARARSAGGSRYRVFELVIIVCSIALASSSAVVGFSSDEYGFRVALAQGLRAPIDLYRFGPGNTSEMLKLIASGTYPWWAAPDFKLHLIRPLSSLLFAFDVALFRDWALGYHLHSLLWYGGLLFAISRLYRRVLPSATAVLALVVFALRGAHVLPYAWIAARHMLVAAVPATLALGAHIAYRDDDWRPGRWLAPFLLVLALAGGETALGVVPFWLAYDGVSIYGSSGGRRRAVPSFRAVATRALPLAAILVTYFGLYARCGGGTRSAPGYLDPRTHPVAFLGAGWQRLPGFVGDALLAFSVEARGTFWLHAGAGFCGALLCAALLWVRREQVSALERRTLAWMIPGALFSTLIGGVSPTARMLLVPDIGFAVLVGMAIRQGLGAALDRAAAPVVRAACAGACFALCIAHFYTGPSEGLAQVDSFTRAARAAEAIAANAELDSRSGQRVILLGASDSTIFFYPKEIIADRAPEKVSCWSVLSAAPSSLRFSRTGERSFRLKRPFQQAFNGYNFQYFASRRFAVGDEIRQCGATIRVEAIDEGTPSLLEVVLDEALESADLTFLVWQEGRLRRFRPPPVGETVAVQWSPPPGNPVRLVRRVKALEAEREKLE